MSDPTRPDPRTGRPHDVDGGAAFPVGALAGMDDDPMQRRPEDAELEAALEADLLAGVTAEPQSQWKLFRRRFFRHKPAMVGLAVLVVLIVACFGAPWLAPAPLNQQDLLTPVQGPSWSHLFGTDDLGRDYFSEVLYAGRVSLSIGIGVALLSTAIGATVGLMAGYFGGWRGNTLMRFTDLFLIIPQIALLAVALQNFGHAPPTIILVLSFIFWMTIARVVRGQVLSVREKEYVEAARCAGASAGRIQFRTILPNLVGVITVNATLAVAAAIVTESTLSFLGFGVQRPETSWGNMLTDARGYVGTSKAHLIWFPGLMLLMVTLAINFLGDGLRDALDPQSEKS
jgi:peptide/nickel transport system permease protein